MPDPADDSEDEFGFLDQRGGEAAPAAPPVQQVVAPPPVAVAPPRMVAPPGVAPVAAPYNPAPNYNPALVGQDVRMQQMLRRMGDAPIAEAEAAVATALKFQATRGYQKDLAGGMNPAEALTKWAPIMFTAPHSGTLGQAANLVRAGRGGADKVMDIGGQAFLYDPATKTMKSLTPAKITAPKLHIAASGEIIQQNADGSFEVKRPPKDTASKLSETDKALLAADVTELKGLEKQIGGTEEHGFGVLHPFGGNKAEIAELRKKASDLRDKIRKDYSAKSVAAPESETISTKDQFDALPSGAIYVGKNGKRYRKP